jgi:hypothetical protein
MYTNTNVYTSIIPTTEEGVDGDEVLCGEDSKINSVPLHGMFRTSHVVTRKLAYRDLNSSSSSYKAGIRSQYKCICAPK